MPSWSNASPPILALLVASFVLSACGDPGEPSVQRIPTFQPDIAPILAEHCVACHSPGQIGPFSLATYDDAKRHADGIRLSTAKRTMPPFLLDNSGACNTYREARWLSNEQIDLLGAWARAGAPLGEASAGAEPAPKPLPTLDRVDATFDMGATYEPDPQVFDDYRCFVVDPAFAVDEFVTGFDVHPGVAKMVHHLTLYALDTPADEATAVSLDAAEPGLGYSCIDDLKVDGRWIVGWGPGSGALDLPSGTGLRMHAGRKALLQIHYNRENGVSPDRTRIDVKLEKSVPREARIERVAATNLYLPPKQRRTDQTDEMEIPRDVELWGLWPHMHKLGTKLHVEALDEGRETCVAKVDHWNFHWQGFANYTSPVHVSAGEKLRITCSYDSMPRDGATTWGQGTNDEMCIAFFYVTDD